MQILDCENCKKLQDEIKNTVDMERLLKQSMQDFNNEHSKNIAYKEFIEHLKEICSLRMNFKNPNEDTKYCLDFIDRIFDDLLLRIKDLEILNKNYNL